TAEARMKTTTKVLLPLLLLAALVAGLYGYYLHAPRPDVPALSASVQQGRIKVGSLSRDYLYYVPAGLPAGAPLLLALHGSLQNAGDMRTYSAYQFERLADEHGFIVVYPQGYKGNWNDCRSTADYPARAENLDDVGLIEALVRHFAAAHQADPHRAFLVGYSNGGHLGLRIALERPQLLAGVAAVAASLPTPDNLACQTVEGATPVLFMNGTRDPINPFNGGRVTLFGFGDRGTVRSSYESALFFARRAGHAESDMRRAEAWSAADEPAQRVELDRWQAAGRA